MSPQLSITTLFLVPLHPGNSPSVIALELNMFLLTFISNINRWACLFFCLFSPPSQHIQLFSAVNLPKLLKRLMRIWIKSAHSRSFFRNTPWVSCSGDVCEITCKKGNIGMVSHTDSHCGLCMKHLLCWLSLLAGLSVRASFQHQSKWLFCIYRISGTHWRCKQWEMKSVTAPWKYRKRQKTFTCSRKSLGELHLTWKLQHHHPLWVIVLVDYFAFWNSCWHLLMYTM